MERPRHITAPVMLKGLNYLLWSRTMKTTLCSHDLWSHIEDDACEDQGREIIGGKKWFQEDQMVLSIIQGSLEPSLLEAYSYCDSAKELWNTLHNVFGNTSNLSRIYQVKKAINDLVQEDAFTKHFGKFRSLWAELEMLRPHTMDQSIILERREQDKVFGLLLTLSPTYGDLIKHLLRADKLPSLEEVCAQIQKEEGSLGLFGGKGELITAHKSTYKFEERKTLLCDHCKKKGHSKDKCWILHPHLKPNKWKEQPRAQEAVANPHKGASFSVNPPSPQGGPASFSACSSNSVHPFGGQHGGFQGQEMESRARAPSPHTEFVKRSDLDALIKALKENSGKVIGKSLHASFIASNMSKPLIVDSGASHHMISDLDLIRNVQPALGHVLIANGTQVPITGIGNLKLFDKESKAFYMPSFTSNLLSVKRATTDLNCHAIFGPNDFVFQDIDTHKILGKGVTRDDLYVLEDLAPSSLVTCLSSSNKPVFEGDLWHARLGHPHFRALELMFPRISFNNDMCEACILGKHCKTVFPKSITVYDHCFELIHSDVWTSPCMSRENHK